MPDTEVASVTELPVPARVCSECEHGYLGAGGVFCHLYRIDIPNENEAQDCEGFDPQ